MAGKKLSEKQIEKRYREYLVCFNAMDFEGLKEYLAEDLYFYRGRVPPLVGRAAFFEFYEKAWQHFDEYLTIGSLKVNGKYLTAYLTNNLRVFKEWLDSPYGPYYKGQEKESSGNVVYAFNDKGKIAVIVDAE